LGGDPNVIAVVVVAGTNSTGNDFVDEKFLPGIGSISGNNSEDTDNDDTGDVSMEGVFIVLKNKNGDVIATTLTDSMGYYVFYDLPAGTYTVTETNLVGVPSDVKDIDGAM
jgi:SdrD B-like domain